MVVNYLTLQVILWLQPTPPSDFFQCPLVPLLPCLGIYLNLLLCMFGVTGTAWAMFAVFEVLGLLIYIFYGYHHSKLGKRSNVNSSKVDDLPIDDSTEHRANALN